MIAFCIILDISMRIIFLHHVDSHGFFMPNLFASIIIFNFSLLKLSDRDHHKVILGGGGGGNEGGENVTW